ncbi:MAG: DUF58 domain-containing protein [Dehalococcoidia bacterium]|nr:DUF58 domain-containing protein [Dehalococcoidia bacterium]
MFGRSLLTIFFVLLLVSTLTRQVALLAVALLVLLSYAVARLWQRLCLTSIEYEREFGEQRVFFGEEVDLRIRISNRKLLPLAWLDVEDDFPAAVTLVGHVYSPHFLDNRAFLQHLISLRWYERVTRRYRLLCNVRGYHQFGPVRLQSGDIFGFFLKDKVLPHVDYLLVYPKVVPISELNIPSKQPFGELRTRQHIFEDPSRLAGVRQYAYGDSLRKIHWKASARTQELQVKLYESTTTIDLIVFLNLTTFRFAWQGTQPILLELAITTAASLVNYGIEEGYRVGLIVNGNQVNSDQPIRIMPSQDPEQLTRVLEALAKVTSIASSSIEALLYRESKNLPWGATIAVVTPLATEDMLAELLRLKKAGHRVALILTADVAPAGNLDWLKVYCVGGEEVWHGLKELQLA